MLLTNDNFDAKHTRATKVPMYLVHFDGETVDYCNHRPQSPTNTLAQYLVSISGLAQKITPEEGRASIGGLTIELLDYNNEITALLATDSYFFHRRKTTIKAGYLGMSENDMLTIATGWITGIRLGKDGVTYIFDVTDPQKWLQRKVFRDATNDAPVTVQGNALNIMLAVMTSTGDGDNGDYDFLDAGNGLGIDEDAINIAHIERVRDDWYPGDSVWMQFTLTEPQRAKDWLETEIWKVLNVYPVTDGQGRFDIRPFKPPLAALDTVQSFTRDVTIGLPSWDANLEALVNEVELHYGWDGSDFGSVAYYVESTSLNNRGPGKAPVTIKSKGLKTSGIGSHADRGSEFLASRKSKVFGRFAAPPLKVSFNAWFSRWLSEAGDIVPFTDSRLPDIEAGVRGLSEERMEIINRSVDWQRGQVKFDLLNTGFARGIYGVVSPSMTVISGASSTSFTVSAADAAKFAGFSSPECAVHDAKMRLKAASVTLTAVNSTTGVITCDDIGSTPAAGWIVTFADYTSCTAEQRRWGFVRSDRYVSP